MNIGLLVSGDLGQKLLEQLFPLQDVSFVMTDRGSSDTIEFCKKNEIECFVGNPRKGKASSFIESKNIRVLISINYLFLIEKDLIDLPTQLAFNIHGSLLPKYRGRTPHVWAIINNEVKTGITAHNIDEGCDTGDIIKQVEVKIEQDETGADILKKFDNLYFPLIKDVLNDAENEKLNFVDQNNERATFFGKRTPGDGRINWNWYKERIYNWVRAQADPYPGAFTYYGDKKIVIDKVSYANYKFSGAMKNGMVISTTPYLIKVTNGVIKIEKSRENLNFIKVNEILE